VPLTCWSSTARILRACPLEERKAKLQTLTAQTDGMRSSEHLKGDGKEIFEHVRKMGLEGLEAAGFSLRLWPGEVLDRGAQSGERGYAAVRRRKLVNELWPRHL
jgi:hypothetical protein